MFADWKNRSLPAAPTDKWLSRDIDTGITQETTPDRLISTWKLFSPIVVQRPGTEAFIEAVRVDEIGPNILQRWRKHNIALLGAVAFVAIICALKNKQQSALLLTFALVFFLLNFLSCVGRDALAERAEFFRAIRHHGRLGLAFPFAVVIVSLGVSLLARDTQTAVEALAFYPGASDVANWWRVFTSSFVHNGWSHLAINAFLLFCIFPLTTGQGSSRGAGVFGASLLVTQFCYFATQLASSGNSALIGISGGIFGLLGYLTATSTLRKDEFPVDFSMTMLGFAVSNLLASHLLSPNASLQAHLVGFLLGILCAATLAARDRGQFDGAS